MDKSIFPDKKKIPGDNDLRVALGETHALWQEIRHYVHQMYPAASDEWNYPGDKYGWSFRIKDKRRAIIYLAPRDKFFRVAFVFGQKATAMVMESQVSDSIKTELAGARVYAEGRGIRIDVKNGTITSDIKTLIDIKLSN